MVRVSLWCVLLVALAVPAAADLTLPLILPDRPAPHAFVTGPEVLVPSGVRLAFVPAGAGANAARDPAPRVPASPGSALLALFGVGGLGLWQVTRCTRKFDRAWLPDWYHAGGPRQVGTAVALEIDWAGAPVPAVRPLALWPTVAPACVCPCAHHPRGRPVLPLAARAPPAWDCQTPSASL